MVDSEQEEAARRASEQEERERRSARRNLTGLFVITFISLGLIVGDIIRDILQR